ncbi:UBIQUITIN-LIKE PROTEIN 3 HCG-1 PROTEIN [Salix purpurea]|uniref:UBIQUITIN-LIKE PROTEIN 3 HCG-1 PROTEIN n=1 Tax=Salix purpurea TaxID=77065 RepID=A0A9Q1ACB5_SALPP|nr:UBIQUITIN-LIKE PROTEIN 3 HCG-1 PROTEIN [Salix purpurea]
MSGVQDQLEIKFRLTDGSDIGPKTFPAATSVATLKENVLALWPKEKENGPRTMKDVKLISAGKILENNRTRKVQVFFHHLKMMAKTFKYIFFH